MGVKLLKFRCVLECDPQCSDLGCDRPNDPSACISCRNSKFLKRYPNKPDKVVCIEDCGKSQALNKVYVNDEKYKDRSGQIVCSECHHECKTACKGLTGKTQLTVSINAKKYLIPG